MSLKKNILANYVSQIYVTLIGITMVPVYVRYMGAEAYGLVGFFAMLQAWFQLLDMGLTPTMARETARYNGGVTDALSLRRLLRAMEGVFIGIAVLGAAAMMFGAESIARSWLKVEQLPIVEVERAIMLMAAIIALRWISGLYRGAINGFEQLVWLSGFNIMMATGRFVLVIPLFIFIGTRPTEFFSYQLLLAMIEITVLVIKTYHLLPKVTLIERTPWQWEPLRGVLKFSLSLAFIGFVSVLVTNLDKLLLSKFLSLTDYAYFTLAVLMSGGITVISAPISNALIPRLTKLNLKNDDEFICLYRNATQLVGVISIPSTLVLAFFSEQILWIWTGNIEISHKAAPILTLYALGNGILALGAFPYYLQLAKGDLRLHLIGNALFVVLLIPALIFATIKYGVIGAGWAWLGLNIIYFLFWIPKVHNKFFENLHLKWIFKDISLIFLPSFVFVSILYNISEWSQNRLLNTVTIVLIVFFVSLISMVNSSFVRGFLLNFYRSYGNLK